MKYRIDLTDYKVPFERWETKNGERKLVIGEENLDVKQHLYTIMRVPGIYENGIETCDGVDLANRFKASDNSVDLTSSELALVKRIFDKLINRPHNPANGQICLGGDTYIPLIQRVFKPEEISE